MEFDNVILRQPRRPPRMLSRPEIVAQMPRTPRRPLLDDDCEDDQVVQTMMQRRSLVHRHFGPAARLLTVALAERLAPFLPLRRCWGLYGYRWFRVAMGRPAATVGQEALQEVDLVRWSRQFQRLLVRTPADGEHRWLSPMEPSKRTLGAPFPNGSDDGAICWLPVYVFFVEYE